MFGYIRPMECELKVREQMLYRAYYCGLCRTIGKRSGQAARMALNYDCAFLALLLDAMDGGGAVEPARCIVKPYRGRQPSAVPSPALDYAADVNVLLAYYKCADDWNDERKASALAAKTSLSGAAVKAAGRWPALAKDVLERLESLSRLERCGTKELDAPADAFGGLMRSVMAMYPGLSDQNRAPCEWMFYNLGRWVYLADAWEDREADRKSGAYNPFLASGADRDAASFQLYFALGEAENACNLIAFPHENGVVDNVMRLGCRHKTRQILAEEPKENPHESI